MILVTVGTQLPFDRLIKAMDALAPELHERVVAQVGPSNYAPQNIDAFPNIEPSKFASLFQEARVIVAHAGIGTIMNARKFQIPIIILPRLASKGEHRNDHQLATCHQIRGYTGIYVADNEDELRALSKRNDLVPPDTLERSENYRMLLGNLKKIISMAME